MTKTKSIYKSGKGKKAIKDYYSEILKRWPVKHENLIIKTTYGHTFVIKSGDESKEALLLFHGSCSNSAMWMGDVKKLSENYCVYAIDIIGEPGNSSENRPDMDKLTYAKWIDEVIDGLNRDKVNIVGNSLGGWMGLCYATYKPQKVRKLVLLATAGIGAAKKSFLFKTIIYMMTGKSSIEKINKLVYGDMDIDKDALKFSDLVMSNYNPRMNPNYFTDDELKKLKMPILFIGGENDNLIHTNKTVVRIKKNINNSKIIVLKNTGHALINLSEKINNFLIN